MLDIPELIPSPNPDRIDQSFGDLGDELSRLQRRAQDQRLPILIMVDGWESSGKGYTIAKIVQGLEPRHYRVRVFDDRTEREADYPFLWRFWDQTPDREQIVIYDRSAYFDLFKYPEADETMYTQRLTDIMNFEHQLVDDGMLVLKYFLDIDQKTQKKAIEKYLDDPYSEFLVGKRDKEQNKHFDTYATHFTRVLRDSSKDYAPWTLINMEDRKEGAKTLIADAIERITATLEPLEARADQPTEPFTPEPTSTPKLRPLDHVTPSEPMDKDDYSERLDTLQDRVRELAYAMYVKDLPTVIVFEGIDAAGKGGTIERLVKGMDPRGYEVHSIEAPTQEELDHHYLWRFYTRMPARGRTAIFDRSWYGRVLVERVEQLTAPDAWQRAYAEINEMEQHMIHADTLVLKYFLTITKDEQEARFQAREEDPDKQHKITDADWEARALWDDYSEAFNEMLVRTSTQIAPWRIISSEDKRTARIQVIEDYIARVEAHLAKFD